MLYLQKLMLYLKDEKEFALCKDIKILLLSVDNNSAYHLIDSILFQFLIIDTFLYWHKKSKD